MSTAGHTPNFTAAGNILPFSCVQATTADPFKLVVADTEQEIVLGVTDGSVREFDSVYHAETGDLVVLQNSEFMQLRAGGTISTGDGLCPTTDGAVVTATARTQFVACDNATSGDIFWAQRVGSVEVAEAGPIVYGSSTPGRFLNDLASGADSLDVVIIGDSNTLSAVAGMWGYHNGFSQTFNDRNINCYGIPVYPTMTGWTPGAYYALGGWNSSAYLAIPTGNLASGNTSGGSTAYSAWTPSTNWVRYGSATASPPAKDDWAYIASGTYADNYNAVEILAAHPLNNASLTLYHRVVYGTFTTGSGSFQGRTRAYAGTVYATGAVQSTVGTSYSANPYEYAFTPAGAHLNSSWSGPTATGPCAILFHTIYCKRKGWSVTSHGYLSGSSSAQINTIMAGVGSTLLQEHLKAIRTRQVAAGGSGRVLLVTHSGINGNETASDWTTCHLGIWNKYKAAWAALGYPASDLAIVSWVGEPRNADDSSGSGASGNLIAVRAAANAMALSNRDMTVVDIKRLMNYQQLVYVPTGGANFYQVGSSPPNVHLSGGTSSTTDGYTVVSNMVISSLMATV